MLFFRVLGFQGGGFASFVHCCTSATMLSLRSATTWLHDDGPAYIDEDAGYVFTLDLKFVYALPLLLCVSDSATCTRFTS